MKGLKELSDWKKDPHSWCFKQHCIYFDDTCACKKRGEQICCISHIDMTCDIDRTIVPLTTRDDLNKFYLDTCGYPVDFEQTFKHTTCEFYEIDLEYATEDDEDEIHSERTLDLINYIKNYVVEYNIYDFGTEMIFTLLDRILYLEEVISKSNTDFAKIASNLNQKCITLEATNKELVASMNEAQKAYNRVIGELERNVTVSKFSKEKICAYIDEVLERSKKDPLEYIKQQDLLQILVYLDGNEKLSKLQKILNEKL